MKNYTMVMRSGRKDMISHYVLVGDDYSVLRVATRDLENQLRSGKINVRNMALTKDGLVSTNGSMDRYTLEDAVEEKIIGTPKPVILNRIEVDGELVGYTIINTMGALQEIKVRDALIMHKDTPFSNGKVRRTKKGDIIQSIEGRYPIRTVEIPKKQVGDINMNVMFYGGTIGKNSKRVFYTGAIIACGNAADLSKVYTVLEKENRELVDYVVRISGDETVRENLGLQMMRPGVVYGVFPTETILKLARKPKINLKNSFRRITSAVLDYTAGDVKESQVIIKDEVREVRDTDVAQVESDKSLKAAKEYANKIVKELKAIEKLKGVKTM